MKLTCQIKRPKATSRRLVTDLLVAFFYVSYIYNVGHTWCKRSVEVIENQVVSMKNEMIVVK